jgi:hypothetical protein
VGAASAPELALRWLISHGHIDGYLCGIAKPSDVDEAVAAAQRGPFTAEQTAHIDATMAALDRGADGFCTGCRYCLPCPEGIDIPAVMAVIAQQRYYDNPAAARAGYEALTTLPAACVECGACEERCTQHLKIMGEMGYAAGAFG